MDSLELFEKLKNRVGEDVAFELMQRIPDSKAATKDDVSGLRNEMQASFNSVERLIRISTWLIGILIALAVAVIKFT